MQAKNGSDQQDICRKEGIHRQEVQKSLAVNSQLTRPPPSHEGLQCVCDKLSQ